MPLDGSTYETDTTRWLIEGRDNLLSCGWNVGTARGPNGSVCMLAALPIWGREADKVNRAHTVLLLAIDSLGYRDVVEAAFWQDAPGRTFDEVMRVYERAIEISRRMEV